MTKTTNIGLNLTTDETTNFGNWRKTIDGNGSGSSKSNMQIIDEEIGNLKKAGTTGKDGVGIKSINHYDPIQSSGYTVTPVSYALTNNEVIGRTVAAKNGIGISNISSGTVTQENGYTVTPINFLLSDSTTKTVNVKAKNGTGGSGTDTTDEMIILTDGMSNVEKIEALKTWWGIKQIAEKRDGYTHIFTHRKEYTDGSGANYYYVDMERASSSGALANITMVKGLRIPDFNGDEIEYFQEILNASYFISNGEQEIDLLEVVSAISALLAWGGAVPNITYGIVTDDGTLNTTVPLTMNVLNRNPISFNAVGFYYAQDGVHRCGFTVENETVQHIDELIMPITQ